MSAQPLSTREVPVTPGLRARLIGDAPVIAITLALFLLCAAIMSTRGIVYDPMGMATNAKLYLVSVGALAVPAIALLLWRHRPASPLRFLGEHLFGAGPLRSHLIAGLPLLVLLLAFMPFFSTMKSAIPTFQPYVWDQTFIEMDRWLFLGHDPWRVLQPVLGYPLVTAFLAVLYHLWLLLNYPGCVLMAFGRIDADLRRRFFLCFTLSWALLGGLLATLLASYGPCFVEPLGGNPYFADQMAYLRAAHSQVPILTLPVQDMLVARFHEQANGLGSGISAMPSMHIAIAYLFWLAGREVAPWLGRGLFVFFIAIWVGSVHLAYHYAVDGLASVVAVHLLWRGSAGFFAWWDRIAAQAALRTNTVPAE